MLVSTLAAAYTSLFLLLMLDSFEIICTFPCQKEAHKIYEKVKSKKGFQEENDACPSCDTHSRKEERCDGYECTDLISQGSKTATVLYCTDTITRRPLLHPSPLLLRRLVWMRYAAATR